MKPTLPTNYKDDILNTSVEGMRRYQMIYNSDNTVSFKDVTPYDQTGSDFGAGDINLTNQAVNQSADAGKIIDDPDTAEATTEEGYIAGVQLFNHVNESLGWKLHTSVVGATEVTLPSDYNEIFIVAKMTHSTGVYRAYSFNIPYIALDNNTYGFLSGYNNADGGGICQYDVSKTKLTLIYLTLTGVNYVNSTTTEVYYR